MLTDISEQSQIQYFYEGMLPAERRMLDAASGGAVVNKTPQEAKDLIIIMAANSQQFGSKTDILSRVEKVNSSSLESYISHLTNLVQNMAMGTRQQAKLCGICAHPEHTTDMCPLC